INSIATQLIRYASCDMLSLLNLHFTHRMWLPRFDIIPVTLNMADRMAEACARHRTNGKQCNLRFKLNKAFHDDTTLLRTTAFHRIRPASCDLILVVADALTFTR